MMGSEDVRPDLTIATGHVNTLVRLYKIGAATCAAAVAARATGTNHIGSLSVNLPLSFLWIGLRRRPSCIGTSRGWPPTVSTT